ncbi:MAG: hypothetical protein EOM15_07750, partial [Spirochaetia bacterium]|nr:hypothetical protein [Spirochaetia bacterium]
VAANLADLDWAEEMVLVRGKGNKERLIPFGRAAREALHQYLPERDALILARATRGREIERQALFLNGRGTRLTARSVERFVQGYGLTETSPITHLNPIYAFIESSVGKSVAMTECKIVDPDEAGNGLIYIRGPQVMRGYYKNEEATAEVLDTVEGWLNTGDIGHIDENNYLYLTGRAKSVIVTEGGKNVYPEEIEDKFQLYTEIEQLCIIAYLKDESRHIEGVRLLVQPDQSFVEGKTTQEIQNRMEEIAKEVNATLQSYKRIDMVTVVDEPLPITSTKKVKRFEVYKKYKIA